jgi:hypothetical protein
MLLSHDDRTRFGSPDSRRMLAAVWTLGSGAVLQDGMVRGVWRRQEPGLTVHHLPLSQRAAASVAAEGRRLARFLGLAPDVRLVRLSR